MQSLRARFLPLFLLRIPGALFFSALAATVFAAVGEPRGALGAFLGWGLYTANILLLQEIARSMADAGHGGVRNGRRGKMLSAVSSSARLVMMFVLLGLIGWGLGRTAVLGACVGLFLSQANLHRGRLWLREAAER